MHRAAEYVTIIADFSISEKFHYKLELSKFNDEGKEYLNPRKQEKQKEIQKLEAEMDERKKEHPNFLT